MRTSATFTIHNPGQFKKQLLYWLQQYREVVFLDSNNYAQQYSSYDVIAATDAFTSLQTDYVNAFDDLNSYQQDTKDWLFGYLSYDLKNDTEKLSSGNHDGLGFPDLFFFQPKKLFLLKGDSLEVQYLKMCDDKIEGDIKDIIGCKVPEESSNNNGVTEIKQRIDKPAYLDKAAQMLSDIQAGNVYEANLCMEFYAENVKLNPLQAYNALNDISEPPFAAFFKNAHQYLLCASPERFLRKEGSKVISQPIKGTARRSTDNNEDNIIKQQLYINEKERSENIMITDLVRNDLSKTAAKATVTVEELCGVHTFKQVHHLISTITSEAKPEYTSVQIIKQAFPMGSMTGAPKISAMEIIEEIEETRRGLYSGALGYFTPDGNFDFNVVIRSILYNADNRYVSFSVGSAITSQASPEAEYEECLLKAKAMRSVLENN